VIKFDRNFRLSTAAALAGAMLLFAACASTPTAPTASMNEAKLAIQAAERVDAGRYANAELDEARQKLLSADKALLADDMVLANRYAEQSTLTAQLASARTEAARALEVNAEMNRGAEALTEEMQRTGDQR
jgi:small-conductance mechanosensitive channel